jgi:uncharacterized protein (TIGR02246 family)
MKRLMDALELLLARDEIRNLLARYPIAFDERDWDTWETLWTYDVAFVVDGVPIEGLPAVRKFMMECLPLDYQSKHLCANPLIEVDPDGVSARAWTDVVWIGQDFLNQIVARYEDTLVKRDGRWLIARREERTIRYQPGPPPMSAAAQALSGDTMRKP